MKNQTAAINAGGPRQKVKLRRLDWRFLLPLPQGGCFHHLLLCGGPEGLGERIIELKLAEEVSGGVASGRRVDAAVLLHNSTVTLEAAAASLEPGALLYQEIASSPWSLLTVAKVRRRLANAGLTLTGLYWAAPNFEECRRYIPLDTDGALQWYFSALFVAGALPHRLIRSCFKLAVGRHSQRGARFLPTLALTAVAGATKVHPPELLAHPQVCQVIGEGDVRPLLLTSGQDDGSRTILLPFASNSRQPQAVIKVATVPRFNDETALEQDVLREVRERLQPALRATVPQPLASFQHHGLAVAVESCAPGQSLWASSGEWGMSPARPIADMELATQWLIDFHRQTESKRQPWDAQAIEQWIDRPLATYAQEQTLSQDEAALFKAVRVHAERLRGSELPLVWQHHDFAPWNLFRAGEQITVIDWEFNRDWAGTRAGLPLCDLLYFLTYWHNVAQKLHQDETELAGMHRLYLQVEAGDRYVQAARRAIARYLAALGVDWQFFPLLLVSTWTERVIYSQRRAQKLDATGSRAATKFGSYVRLLAAHAGELFDGKAFWRQAVQQSLADETQAAEHGRLSEVAP